MDIVNKLFKFEYSNIYFLLFVEMTGNCGFHCIIVFSFGFRDKVPVHIFSQNEMFAAD